MEHRGVTWPQCRGRGSLRACRAAASSSLSATESSDKLKLQLRQAQQMTTAVARKKDDMMIKLKRLADKQVWPACPFTLHLPAAKQDLVQVELRISTYHVACCDLALGTVHLAQRSAAASEWLARQALR